MSLPFISGRGNRGGSFAAGPAAPAATSAEVTRQSDLVHWWKLDDTSDEIGDATLTHVNDANIQSTNAMFGSAWDGDGTGDESYAADSVTAIGAEISFTCWARIESTGSLEAVVALSDTSSGAYATTGMQIIQVSAHKLYIKYGVKDSGYYISAASIAAADAITLDRWYFLAGTWNETSGNLKFYTADADGGGTPDSETALEGTFFTGTGKQLRPSDSLVIGDSSWGELDGQVDDIRYYNAELPKSDIDAIYNGGAGDM